MARETESRHNGSQPSGPADRLKAEVTGLVDALTNRAVSSVRSRVEETTGRLTDYVEGGGGPGLMAAVAGAKSAAEGKGPVRSMLSAGFAGAKEKMAGMFGGKGGGGKRKLKFTNIVETIDVGVPVRLAYDQWTQFSDFPTFMKKVESAERDKNEQQKVSWKAQVFWSHRMWEATILEARPDERIVWRSEGEKGHVDGAVTFHELTPTLTRIVLILEYHPQGMFEHTGNIWRAQGRRARLELKHFARHVMAHAVLEADDVEGWRGVIEDGEVVKDHETAMEEGEPRERGEEPSGDEEPVVPRQARGNDRGRRPTPARAGRSSRSDDSNAKSPRRARSTARGGARQ